MIETILDIPTKDGAVETFVCHPERGSYPPVLFLMDAPGIREELLDMARRLATVGYYVLLPNLYYRAGKDTKYGPDVLTKGSEEQARMRAVRTKMTIPPVMEDVAALIAFADSQKASKKGPVGAHGYCMSGPYALAAAARYPDRVAAAASVLWHLAGERCAREPASQSRQGQRRALCLLRRARRTRPAEDGRGVEGAVRQVRQSR
jgi:Dienelactone hydrolase and related enzymes